MQPRHLTPLAFLAAGAVGGAVWGTLVRAYWDRPGRFGQPSGPLAGFALAFREWGDVVPIAIGTLAVAALYRWLLGPATRVHWGWRAEAGILAALTLAALIWGYPQLEGLARWEGVLVHVAMARLSLLALQLALGIACGIGAAAASQLGPALLLLLLYLAGRGAFAIVFMKALRLQGENAMYLIVPFAAAVAEGLVLVIVAVACLLVSRFRRRGELGPRAVSAR